MFRARLFPCPLCPIKIYLSDGPIVSDTFSPNTHRLGQPNVIMNQYCQLYHLEESDVQLRNGINLFL